MTESANTRIQNEHSFSILMLEARKFDQEIRPESENRNATMAGHGWPWLVMAGHGWPSRLAMGWPWPAMAGHGRAWLVMSGQWPVNGQPRTQRSSTWQRLALRSCFWARKLHFASGSSVSCASSSLFLHNPLTQWRPTTATVLHSLLKHTFPLRSSTTQVTNQVEHGLLMLTAPSTTHTNISGKGKIERERPLCARSLVHKTKPSTAMRTLKRQPPIQRSIQMPSKYSRAAHDS